MCSSCEKKGNVVSKVPLNIDVLIELYVTISQWHSLDPLECKNFIRHLNGTNNEILNYLPYNKIFTLLEEHFCQLRLEQYQTLFTATI